MEKRTAKRAAVFYPRTMGVFILLIIILSFTAGTIRREPVLSLTGAVILAIWTYCLVMTLLLALFHRRRAKNIFIRLEPERIVCAGWTNAAYQEKNDIPFGKNIFQLPGILVRCRVLLNTKDGRRVTYDFKPENKTGVQQNTFQIKKRGAYFSVFDEFAVFDILGFFRFAYRISAAVSDGSGARLLASPNAAAEQVFVKARGGEANRQDALTLERTDYLIDHRPYVPGDDPRRINWKLYSHGGELIVRQGEREPPPFSNMTILIDTQYDALYAANNFAAEAVDSLCENALSIINNAGKETNIQIGVTGYNEKSVPALPQAEPGFFLAYPAAMPAKTVAALPPVTEDRGIIILALPRIDTGHSALDKFLTDNANRSIELIFIYGAGKNESALYEKYAAAALMCARFYNTRPGVRAQVFGVQ
ncbi:MAG: DUF58 domain-containing protein [Treponema sp.]|jgi:hypothetical protein|nr:DUF58 domain-containing protein [Treponema sp.]